MTHRSAADTVAVVITCHNYGRFLRDALDSAFSQSHPPTQVVVVDDGSTDDTAAVCEMYGEAVEYIYQEPSGANAARNTGLSRVHGVAYVMFLDADDRLDPEYIRRCLAALEADPGAAFAYTQWRKFGEDEGVSAFPSWSIERLLKKNFVHIAALLRTEVLAESPFDVRLRKGNMDWDLYLTLAERGRRGVLVDEPLLHYRQHGSSVQDVRRKSPYLRPVIAMQLAWKHRRLYGWPRLIAQMLRQGSEISLLAIRRVRQRLRAKAVGAARKGLRGLRQIPRRFPGR